MTDVVVHGAKTVTRVHWEIIDAKMIMPKSFTIISSICLMVTCCRFGIVVVFQYVIMMNVLCWQAIFDHLI